MNTEYPTLFQCPETGGDLPEPGLFCKKCSHHGTIKKPLQRQLLTEEGTENTSDWKIEKPCTICAMANDGFWGWEEGHFDFEGKCEKCDENCKTCEGEANKCTSCPEEHIFLQA